MTILAAPLLVVTLLALGSALLLVTERKGEKVGRAFLGVLAFCVVIGLTVTAARSPNGPFGSLARATPRTMPE